jgi:drug/metabolite transporter (DMT)-like permease
VTLAAFSYGIVIVYTRKHLRGLPPLIAPTAQILMATLYLIPISLIVDQPFRLPIPSWPAIGSLLALAVVGTALAYVVYYFLLDRTSATYVSMVTYLAPVIGVVLGIVILDEQLSWTTYAGCGLILVGVMVVNGVFKSITLRRTGDAAVRP